MTDWSKGAMNAPRAHRAQGYSVDSWRGLGADAARRDVGVVMAPDNSNRHILRRRRRIYWRDGGRGRDGLVTPLAARQRGLARLCVRISNCANFISRTSVYSANFIRAQLAIPRIEEAQGKCGVVRRGDLRG